MSKPNKVNKNNYTQRGRLTPDDMARERQKQLKVDPVSHRERVKAHELPFAEAPAGKPTPASVKAAPGKPAVPAKATARTPAARGAVRSRSGSEE